MAMTYDIVDLYLCLVSANYVYVKYGGERNISNGINNKFIKNN